MRYNLTLKSFLLDFTIRTVASASVSLMLLKEDARNIIVVIWQDSGRETSGKFTLMTLIVTQGTLPQDVRCSYWHARLFPHPQVEPMWSGLPASLVLMRTLLCIWNASWSLGLLWQGLWASNGPLTKSLVHSWEPLGWTDPGVTGSWDSGAAFGPSSRVCLWGWCCLDMSVSKEFVFTEKRRKKKSAVISSKPLCPVPVSERKVCFPLVENVWGGGEPICLEQRLLNVIVKYVDSF